MKREEIIELNGVEYTVELNRQSAIKIEKYTKLNESLQYINSTNLKYVDEIKENENPFADEEDLDKMEEESQNKLETLKKLIVRAFWIWLYPNHKLDIKEVEEILKPYVDDEDEKLKFISEKYGEYIKLSADISLKYNEERKNLKAQANK